MPDETVKCSRSGRTIEPHETAFVVDGQVVCREVHDELRPACPYCHKSLDAKPAPYSPCPHCRQTILVRTNQDLYDSTLLTREQSDEFDRIEAIVRPFKNFGIRTRDYLAMKDKLRDEMELDRDATDSEIVWQFFHEAARRTSDPARLADLYLLQARFVHAQGKDHRPFQHKWARTVLQNLKAQGATHVRLEGLPDQCLPSRRLHGTVVPIDEAVARPPIPCPDCNHKLIANEMKFRPPGTMPADTSGRTPRLARIRATALRQIVADRPFCECRYVRADASDADATAPVAADTDADPGADLLNNF
jgi:DNA-directed RNA polymerase subunit RPC12/RpoP